MLKKIFISIILWLSIFSFTENTFSDNNCNNQENDFLCISKVKDELKPVNPNLPLDKIVSNMVVYLLWFLGLLSTLYWLYWAWNIFSSASDEEKVKKWKTIIFRAAIWLVVIFSAYAITNFVIKEVIFQEWKTTSGSWTTGP